jgi:hypothetical protein
MELYLSNKIKGIKEEWKKVRESVKNEYILNKLEGLFAVAELNPDNRDQSYDRPSAQLVGTERERERLQREKEFLQIKIAQLTTGGDSDVGHLRSQIVQYQAQIVELKRSHNLELESWRSRHIAGDAESLKEGEREKCFNSFKNFTQIDLLPGQVQVFQGDLHEDFSGDQLQDLIRYARFLTNKNERVSEEMELLKKDLEYFKGLSESLNDENRLLINENKDLKRALQVRNPEERDKILERIIITSQSARFVEPPSVSRKIILQTHDFFFKHSSNIWRVS